MSTITTEMDDLEKAKVKYQYLARFHELKIQLIKAEQNVAKVKEEIAKCEQHLSKIATNEEY